MPVSQKLALKPLVPLEADVQRAVIKYLSIHPRVAWCARFNSGKAMLAGRGRGQMVTFNTLEGCPDVLGQLTDGRVLAVEVKRPGWRKPTDDREKQQATFLEKVRMNNGIGIFACRWEDVRDAIAEAMQ